MKYWQIYNKNSGSDLGIFKGRTPMEALCNMHKDAGYRVGIKRDLETLIFKDISAMECCTEGRDLVFEERTEEEFRYQN